MPSIITHQLFVRDVLKQITNTEIKKTLEANQLLFELGSNGPDILFYYHMRPFELLKSHHLNHIGSQLHKSNINAFYESFFYTIQKETSTIQKERQIAYAMGHLCHWILDKNAHPYIFYFSGINNKKEMCYHHQMETQIDAMLLQIKYQKTIKDYDEYFNYEINDTIVQTIAKLYIPAIQKIFKKKIYVYDIRKTLFGFVEVLKLLHDQSQKKKKIISKIENFFHVDGVLSSHIIPILKKDIYDVLNLKQITWCHPCDKNEISNQTFLNIYEKAVQEASNFLNSLDLVFNNKQIHIMLNKINDQAYDTGRKQAKMIYSKNKYQSN